MTPATAPIPFLGKWQSTIIQYSPPAPIPMPQETATSFRSKGDHIQYDSEVSYTDGRLAHVECVFKLDGNPYTVTGSPLADAAAFRSVDGHTIECTMTSGGKPSVTVRSTVSGDGNRLTGRWELSLPEGGTYAWKTVAERQPD